MEIPEFTREDYLQTPEPYEFLYKLKDNAFLLKRQLTIMSDNAKKVGIRNFISLYREYEKSQNRNKPPPIFTNTTNFEGQEIELMTENWIADDTGIYRHNLFDANTEIACVHPIMPVQRLVNIDTGIEKIKLAYKKGGKWRYTIEDKKTLSSNNGILELANKGVAVTSDSAKHLVRYLHDVENINYERIPEKNSVSRLGWIEGSGFSPYFEELIFDGDANFKTFFESVDQKGKYEKWLDIAKRVRKSSVYGRISLAASFASILLSPLSCLPFFVHFWGETEGGKTVNLMLAASVWANPELGRFIHTFNSTAVGREKSAGFVNSLPLILDELQIVNDKKQFDKDIYLLSEGVGRTRGTKFGGIDKSSTWANCIITSGEQPITSNSSGGGAVNRIIEIECKNKLFDDPRIVANTIRKNYGFAGRIFVDNLRENNYNSFEHMHKIWNDYKFEISKHDTMDKQAMAICAILTADVLATMWIFQDGNELTIDDVLPFLSSKKEVSAHERAYEYICDHIASNRHRFSSRDENFDIWGDIEISNNPFLPDKVFIIRNHFNRICEDAGFNSKAFLSWLRQNNKIETKSKAFTNPKRINGIPCNCVWLNIIKQDV